MFYVAVTRAKRYCFLSYAKTRFKWGQFQYCVESSFLKNIPNRFFTASSSGTQGQTATSPFTSRTSTVSTPRPTPTLRPVSLQRPSTVQPSLHSASASGGASHLNVGDRVEHERFGQGTVMSLEGSGNSAKAVVNFQGVGCKTLLLSFAKLKKLMS